MRVELQDELFPKQSKGLTDFDINRTSVDHGDLDTEIDAIFFLKVFFSKKNFSPVLFQKPIFFSAPRFFFISGTRPSKNQWNHSNFCVPWVQPCHKSTSVSIACFPPLGYLEDHPMTCKW